MGQDLPGSARIVIVGGGIVGCSIAYHLARRGVTEVVLLERAELTSGTTWHAAGLVGQLRATHNLTRLAQYTSGLFASLEAETGQATGFRQTGSVSVAAGPERFEELKRQASMARVFGLQVELLDARGIAELVPLARVDDLVGGVFLPGDGVTNPVDTTRALARGARAAGVVIREHTPVSRILVEGGRAVGVECSIGGEPHRIRCDVVVNAAGMWSRELGGAVGATVPLHAAEHYYVVTEPIEGLSPRMPVLRDQDGHAYVKPEAGKLLVGWFEPVAKPWPPRHESGRTWIPGDFSFGRLPVDFDHLEPMMESATHRVPALAQAGIQLFFNGPESFTPDDRYLLGESPEVAGLFLACGFNSIGIQSSGGAGKVVADWIIDGHPPMDVWDVDIRRMMPFQHNASYLRDRTVETLGLLYAMHWPYRQPEEYVVPFCTTDSRTEGRASAWWRGGSGPTGTPRPGRRLSTGTASGVSTGCRCRARNTGPCVKALGCSTCHRSASSWSRAPMLNVCSTGCAPTRWPSRSGPSSTPSGSTTGAPSRPT